MKLTQRTVVYKARKLRRKMTIQEWKLWNVIRNRKQFPQNFRRQHPINPFIVDFCSLSQKLIIEIDGGQHKTTENKYYDLNRTLYLEDKGFTVLRFWNSQIDNDLEDVIKQITEFGK